MSDALWAAVKGDLNPDDPVRPGKVPIGRRRRRGYCAGDVDTRAAVELRRDEEGFVRWLYTPPRLGSPSGRRT